MNLGANFFSCSHTYYQNSKCFIIQYEGRSFLFKTRIVTLSRYLPISNFSPLDRFFILSLSHLTSLPVNYYTTFVLSTDRHYNFQNSHNLVCYDSQSSDTIHTIVVLALQTQVLLIQTPFSQHTLGLFTKFLSRPW